ncbi:MAG: hypothetical protein V4616_05795 [Bacteroidota bacterium]
MRKEDKEVKNDDYTDPTPTDSSNNTYHGSSAETGEIQDSITPNGEIIHEQPDSIDNVNPNSTNSVPDVEDEANFFVKGTEADVTKEDLEALGPRDLSMDMGADEDLKHRVYPVDFAGEDLDIPGSELDDDQEDIGSEDEENNSYSRGQD